MSTSRASAICASSSSFNRASSTFLTVGFRKFSRPITSALRDL
nr:MAG TPA: hypothetical protein [Caudoviricetes sp.]